MGAPPDAFNQRGQDWALPPYHPRALAAAGYRPLAELFDSTLGRVPGDAAGLTLAGLVPVAGLRGGAGADWPAGLALAGLAPAGCGSIT